MSKRLIEIDPWTATKTYHDYDHSTNTTYITQEQDVELTLKQTRQMRNNPSYQPRGRKEEHYHFARVPNSVLVELMQKYNLDWSRKEDMPRIEKVLERDYKYLLTVDKI